MSSAILGQGKVLGHRVKVDTMGGGVVPSVADVENAALAQEGQGDSYVGEGHVVSPLPLAVHERLEGEALLTELLVVSLCAEGRKTEATRPEGRTLRLNRSQISCFLRKLIRR